MSEVTIYSVDGDPEAYLVADGSIYLWDGEAVAFVLDDKIYQWSGEHIGWFVDGVMYDGDGDRVGFIRSRCPVVTSVEPVKSVKSVRSVRGVRSVASVRTALSTGFSHQTLEAFLTA